MKKIQLICSILILVIMRSVFAGELPQTEPVPGGVVVLTLNKPVPLNASLSFQGQRVTVINTPEQAFAIIGIPLATKPGNYILDYQYGSTHQQQTFTIHAKAYPTQYLTIKNKRKVNPNPADLTRIKREYVTLNKFKSTWSANVQPTLQFNWPVKGRISSAFGLQRFYNGEPRSPHAGLDIAAPSGTPIKAAAAGRVIGTGNFFYSGNTVYLDHGQGLITMYGHMSKITVKAGQWVNSDTTLGLVGQTGRATGPHLHWGVLLNKALVNPVLFLTPAK